MNPNSVTKADKGIPYSPFPFLFPKDLKAAQAHVYYCRWLPLLFEGIKINCPIKLQEKIGTKKRNYTGDVMKTPSKKGFEGSVSL